MKNILITLILVLGLFSFSGCANLKEAVKVAVKTKKAVDEEPVKNEEWYISTLRFLKIHKDDLLPKNGADLEDSQ